MRGGEHMEGDWWPDPLPINTVIGERSYLYSSFAFRHYRSTREVGVRIGDDTGIYAGTIFDLGPYGEVRIGDFCTVVGPTISTNGPVLVGDYAFISHDVFIVDDDAAVPPDDRRDLDRPSPAVMVGDDVWIGTRTVIRAGVTLGDGAIVGAGAVVVGSVPPYGVVVGNPARIVGSSPPSEDPRASVR